MDGLSDNARKRRQWAKPAGADLSLKELVSGQSPSSSPAGYAGPAQHTAQVQPSARRPLPFGAPVLAGSKRTSRNRPDDPAALERGFNTYLSGANEERVREQRRREAAGPRGVADPAGHNAHIRLESQTSRGRRHWGALTPPGAVYLPEHV
ncbi:hypothetical protein WJX72_005054 [[Myrmecia] bisecta]|uniref:Uncharacterized protein n=1 Tax=[Myrmecia] bisecta TaxID=41462 RepID=A0AAW1R663_9CHLO